MRVDDERDAGRQCKISSCFFVVENEGNKNLCSLLLKPLPKRPCRTGNVDVVLKAVLGGFREHHPADTESPACVVDVSDERDFLNGPFRRLGV